MGRISPDRGPMTTLESGKYSQYSKYKYADQHKYIVKYKYKIQNTITNNYTKYIYQINLT